LVSEPTIAKWIARPQKGLGPVPQVEAEIGQSHRDQVADGLERDCEPRDLGSRNINAPDLKRHRIAGEGADPGDDKGAIVAPSTARPPTHRVEAMRAHVYAWCCLTLKAERTRPASGSEDPFQAAGWALFILYARHRDSP